MYDRCIGPIHVKDLALLLTRNAEAGSLVIVMEFADSGDLDKMIKKVLIDSALVGVRFCSFIFVC